MSARARLSVFVVDDEEVIASTVARILEIDGFSATAFANPVQALRSARLEAPDLLISDVLMPGMSGIELALRMKQECPNCAVLLFSGQAATSDLLSHARHLGHNFHLVLKPIHPIELLIQVRSKLNLRNFQPMENGSIEQTAVSRRIREYQPTDKRHRGEGEHDS